MKFRKASLPRSQGQKELVKNASRYRSAIEMSMFDLSRNPNSMRYVYSRCVWIFGESFELGGVFQCRGWELICGVNDFVLECNQFEGWIDKFHSGEDILCVINTFKFVLPFEGCS